MHDILGFENFTQDRFIANVPFCDRFDNLLAHIKAKMPDSTLRITKASDFVQNLIIVCGAGCGVTRDEILSENDCIITGDVKYHDAMRFLSQKVSIIDVGHYHSEGHFGAILQKNLKKIGYKGIILTSKNPFKENL